MRGHITQRSKGSYSIKISLGKDPTTGKYKSQWFTIRGGKKDAEKRLSELLHQLDTGAYMKPGKTTVADYLTRWLADYVRPNLSPRGFERYESIIRVHLIPKLGHIALTQLRSNHLQRHYSAMLETGLAPLSVRYHHVVLHKALATALKWGLVTRNVADGVDLPRAHRSEIQTWDEAEISCFLEAAEHTQYHALFYTALYTGARRSELLALRWQDIDFIYSQVYISRSLHHLQDGSFVFTQPKSDKSRRTIALPPSAFLVLDTYRKQRETKMLMCGLIVNENDLVFCTVEGKPLRPNTVSRAWSMLATKVGSRLSDSTMHAIRTLHSCSNRVYTRRLSRNALVILLSQSPWILIVM